MATHSNILAWRISWTEEPGGLHSMGSQSQDTTEQHTHTHTHTQLINNAIVVSGEQPRDSAVHISILPQNLLPYLFILKVIPQKRMSVATCLLITIAGKGPERADPFSELGWFTCAFLLQFRSVQSLSCIRLFATP